jgi:polymorphic toxin system DSP-PTPase phosphatase-like protein
MFRDPERGRCGMLSRFYWLIDAQLAGCSRPGVSERRRAAAGRSPEMEDAASLHVALDEDLAWLREQGIGALLSLTETPLAEGVITRHGLPVLHLPIPDLQAPTPDEFVRALGFIDRQRAERRAVAVHCLAGQGRTGTVLAAFRIRAGLAPEQALRELRAVCPGAVGAEAQEQALHRFAARRDWIL